MEGSVAALHEHYGIKICSSLVNKITQQIGRAAKNYNATEAPPTSAPAPLLIAEIDGSMSPIVEYKTLTEEQKSQGKKRARECYWKEFRLCTVNKPGEIKTRYGVTDGDPFEAGCMMHHTCKNEGMNHATQIHGVADGAPWIAEQYEEQFGANHKFHIDFYHASEYLAAAAKERKTNPLEEPESTAQKNQEWYHKQQQKLRESKAAEVIKELAELNKAQPENESIASCLRYLSNREEHLDYARAIAKALPIGSGTVESGHRSVLQKRLKKPGAWWKKENAETMAQLKTLQANGDWENLWKKSAA